MCLISFCPEGKVELLKWDKILWILKTLRLKGQYPKMVF
jgi:hypothetical protein